MSNVERDAEMESAPILDAQRVAEMEEELAALRGVMSRLSAISV